jgi:hypothetical protein
MKNMPNFFVIGAARAGTTALYNFLVEHSQIFMPEIKEPGFFMLEGTQYANPYSDRNYSISDIEAYQDLFLEARPEHIAVGEATTGYLTSAHVPERIRQHVPDARLIALLRNPVDRAYSEWELLSRAGREPLSFAEAVAREPREPVTNLRWDPDELKYLRKGMYHAHLTRFYEVFDPAQIAVFLYDDWRTHQQETLCKIYGFFGVDDTFAPDMKVKHNLGGVPKNTFVYNLIFRSTRLKKLMKQMVPTRQLKQVRGLFLDFSKEELTPALRSELIEYYRSDVEALQGLLDRDLSHWLKV